jgi:hypothetical protein
MRRVRVFIFLVIAGGFGGLLGSVIGAAFGRRGLFAGGFAGGIVLSGSAAWLAGRLRWMPAEEVKGTALGAMLGFLAGATIAVNTLSSPVGPVLGTLCIGAGGLVGGWLGRGSGSAA